MTGQELSAFLRRERAALKGLGVDYIADLMSRSTVNAAIDLSDEWADTVSFYESTDLLLRAAAKVSPNDSAIPLRLGRLYEKHGNLDAAITEYERSIELQPSAQALLRRGKLLASAKKDGRRAHADFSTIVTNFSTTPEAREAREWLDSFERSRGPVATQALQYVAAATRPTRSPLAIGWLRAHSPTLAQLDQVIAYVDALDDSRLDELAGQLSAGCAISGDMSSAKRLAPMYLAVVRELPTLLELAVQLLGQLQRPTIARALLANALCYTAIPRNIVLETRRSGYGLIDDWLIVHATVMRVEPGLLGAPPAHLSRKVEFVAGGLPRDKLSVLSAIMQSMDMLRDLSRFAGDLSALEPHILKLMTDPVPTEWAMGPVPNQSSRVPQSSQMPGTGTSRSVQDGDSRTTFHSTGSVTTGRDGSTVMSFKGGGYCGVLANGDIVFS